MRFTDILVYCPVQLIWTLFTVLENGLYVTFTNVQTGERGNVGPSLPLLIGMNLYEYWLLAVTLLSVNVDPVCPVNVVTIFPPVILVRNTLNDVYLPVKLIVF